MWKRNKLYLSLIRIILGGSGKPVFSENGLLDMALLSATQMEGGTHREYYLLKLDTSTLNKVLHSIKGKREKYDKRTEASTLKPSMHYN